jgi:uncharacterized membrane protein YesL
VFFNHNYAKEGDGIDPNAPEKTGFRRFFEIIGLECSTIVGLNLLFLVSCIPIVTIPPALFAMQQVIRRMVQDLPVDCFYHYRTAFKKYWKVSYGAFFLTYLPLGLSGYGAAFYLGYAAENLMLFLPFLLCSTIFLVVLLSSTYLYGLLSTGRGMKESLKLALILGVGRPLRAILAVLGYYTLPLACILAFPISLGVVVLFGFTLPCLLGNFYLRTVLKKYPGPEQEAEEALRAMPERDAYEEALLALSEEE